MIIRRRDVRGMFLAREYRRTDLCGLHCNAARTFSIVSLVLVELEYLCITFNALSISYFAIYHGFTVEGLLIDAR